MTTIIGLKDKSGVYIGGDSRAINGETLVSTVTENQKVFRVYPPDMPNGILIGVSGYVGAIQSLRYGLADELNPPHVDIHAFEYTVIEVAPSILECLSKGNAGVENKDGIKSFNGSLIIAHSGNLYHMDSYFQIVNRPDFWSIGSGMELALGAMAALEDLPAEKRILRSLEIASSVDSGTDGPFVISQL